MSRPLEGRTVIVTRSADRADALSSMLEERGATAIAAPAIRITPARSRRFDTAIRDTAMGSYAWVAFTSAEGVAAWFVRAEALAFDARGLRARVAAVGTGTAEALRAHGVVADLVPPRFTTAALGRAFPRGGGKVLLPRADIAPRELEEALRRKGWEPVRIDAYRSRPARTLPAAARRALDRGVDAVTFTSASTVEGFLAAGGTTAGAAVVCIGPVTARAARDAGLRVAAVARPHSLAGLVEAVVRALRRRPAVSG